MADRLDVIERGGFEGEGLSAVDAAPAAVPHRRLLYSALSFGMTITCGNPVLALPAGTARETAR
ncbi:MAG: hypothetical protein ACT4P6_14385 [Gemmatimonadaceae bacterium]